MVRSAHVTLVLASTMLVVAVSASARLRAQQPHNGAAAKTEAGARTDAPAASHIAAPEVIARGRYIVEDVATCWRCHSPVDHDGHRDHSQWLLGGQIAIASTVPVGADWAIVAPRIAGAPPGTDASFIHLMMTGISRTGYPPRQPMPQFRMTKEDAEAVLAYLKSIGGHGADLHK